MATTLDLADVAKPAYVEFNSLLPLIRDAKKASPYQSIYGCYEKTLQRMIRVGDMKLMIYPRAKRLRLYDLAADPLELDDLSGKPQHWASMRKLFKRLVKLQRRGVGRIARPPAPVAHDQVGIETDACECLRLIRIHGFKSSPKCRRAPMGICRNSVAA